MSFYYFTGFVFKIVEKVRTISVQNNRISQVISKQKRIDKVATRFVSIFFALIK